MMQLGQVSRASFYRFDESTSPGQDVDMDLRDALTQHSGKHRDQFGT